MTQPMTPDEMDSFLDDVEAARTAGRKLPTVSPNDTVVLTVAVGTNASGEVVSVSSLPSPGKACPLCGEVAK